jgi:dipeptidyl aminopeptidase/acylaminoacyl peptidase
MRRTMSFSVNRFLNAGAIVLGLGQLLLFVALSGSLSPQLSAQQPAAAPKRSLTHQDYDSWRNLQGPAISRDGKFVAYVMQPQDGDGEFFVKNVQTGTEWRAPRGYRPPTPPPDPSDPAATAAFVAQGRLLRASFTADSKYVIFNIEPTKAELNKARKEKRKPEDFPKNGIGIMNLANGQVTVVEGVKSFQVSEDGAGYFAYLRLPGKPEPAAAGAATPPPAAARPAARRKEYGTELVLRRLSDGNERSFSDVLDYSLSKDAKTLIFAVSAKSEETNGAFAVPTEGNAAPVSLLNGPGKYTKFTWDEKETQMAFISDRDDAAAKQPKFKVYHWSRNDPKATEVVAVNTPGFPSGAVVSEKGSISFSYDGTRLFVSSAPPADPEPAAENAVPDEERVVVDLWHWKDDYVQPMQKVRAIADRDRSFRGIWHIKEKKFVQLADSTMENVNPSSTGLYALGTDDRAYRPMINYDTGYSDYYLVNTVDGSKKLLQKKLQFGMSWSPDGKYAIFYDGKDWNSVSIPDGKVTNLTSKLKVRFSREDHDSPSVAGSYGIAGWTKGDAELLINDRYDIWQIAPDGSSAKMLTGGAGRKSKTEMRLIRLDPDERFIDPSDTLLIRAESEQTRDTGFYKMKFGGTPEQLIFAAKRFGIPVKAKDADTLMVQATRFNEFPDIWVASTDFKNPTKISNGDAQRAPFKWGTAELINYKTADNLALQGVLIKPDNFDPKKKYPMMVYLYEKLSNTVNNFQNPGPGTSVNFSYYASNDYVVFMPDIVYTIGYPGQSAMKSIMPGVDAVVKQGFINENAIGIQGHSWGGYQIAYMVTQTNRFKAAAPGALVSNMTSAYGGIRWGSGMPRQFQYEKTQSRIGGTLWDAKNLYLENSPLFFVPKVTTPLLMLHNDADDAVPWYQGIEFYLALRRLNKEAYLFNYNGELHGLRRRQNQKDYTRRMQEFFDHHLKGAPAPEWMQKGIKFLDREKEKEKYRQPAK